MENRFAQTVDSSYYSRLPCGVLHVPSVACAFNVFIISDAAGKVNSRRSFFSLICASAAPLYASARLFGVCAQREKCAAAGKRKRGLPAS